MNIKKLVRKTLCIMLAAAAVGGFTVAAAPVFTGDGIVAEAALSLKSGDFKYQVVNDDYAVITKYTGEDKDVVIPSEIHSFTVISIGSGAFSGNNTIESVEIPEGVVSIGVGAFSRCLNLKSVKIPETVQLIDYKAFYGCASLSSVEIPEFVTVLGGYVFADCVGLKSVAFIGDSQLVDIPDFAFNNCISLESVEFPTSFRNVGIQAFGNCTSLASVEFYVTNGNIGARAFVNCSSLSEVVLGEDQKSIDIEAFYKCPLLNSIEIPESVEKIGLMAFGYGFDSSKIRLVKNSDFRMIVYGDSAGQKYAEKNGFKYDVVSSKELVNNSYCDDNYTVGKPVTLTGSAEGGTGEYTYTYCYKRVSNDNWKTIGSENTKETSAKFTPTAKTIYEIRIIVTDSDGQKEEIYTTIAPDEDIVVNLSRLASDKVKLGKNVKIYGDYTYSGETVSETETYSYYFRKSGNTAWKKIGQEDTENKTASFKPTSAGTYEVKVIAKLGSVSDEKIMKVTVVE